MSGSNQETFKTPHGKVVNKVDAFNWKTIDQKGQFEWVHKSKLRIDEEYQRTNINNYRINDLAREWSWRACGCLIVGKRSDGSLWLIDGQHRKKAADKRSDIQELPCLIFDVENKSDEANGFLSVNINRGNVSNYHQFRASLVAGDEHAIALRDMVGKDGYRITNYGGEWNVVFIATLSRCYRQRPDLTERIWTLCANLASGESFTQILFDGLFFLEKTLDRQSLPSLLSETYLPAIQNYGLRRLEAAAKNSAAVRQKGGARIWAEGIRELLNKGRRSHRIPSMLIVEASSEEGGDA